MLKNSSSKAIIAKARAIYGTRLREDDIKQLVSKANVTEVCRYLKGTKRFSYALSSVHENTVHRGQLETLIKRSNFEIYEKIYIYDNHENKGFYDYVLNNMEVKQILNAIMYINAGNHDEFIASVPAFLMSHSSINLMQLAKANSFDEILTVLEGTKYHRLLKFYAPKENGKLVDFSACEVALYTDYYKMLLKNVDTYFKGKMAKNIKNTFLHIIDLYNLLTIFRLRVMFDMEPERINQLLIPIQYKLTKKHFNKLMTLKTAEEMAAEMPSLPYFKGIPTISSGSIENAVDKVKKSYLKRLIRFSDHAPVVIMALLELLEIESKNVTTIIEGIRYNMPPNDIEHMLV